MCDVDTAASAFGEFSGGIAGSIGAKANTTLETGMLSAMQTLTAAKSSDAKSGIYDDYRKGVNSNIAAMAVSGFSSASFSSITKGNKENLRRNLGRVDDDAALQTLSLELQKNKAQLEGKFKAQAALYGGVTDAVATLNQGEAEYQKYKDDETSTRTESFKKSLGVSMFMD